MKQRLTERADGTIYCKDSYDKIIDRLADFEDKIENGTLIELPCKVYFLSGSMQQIFECEIKNIIYDTVNGAFDKTAIGKTVFFVQAEAEKNLKNLKEKNNGR